MNKKDLRKTVIKMSIILAAIAIVLLFATIAWFTMNKEISTSGMGIKVATLPFELKTEGVMGYSDDSYLPAEYVKLTQKNVSSVLTTANGQSIEWLVTKDYHAKNFEDKDNLNFKAEDDIGIRPGASGALRFWIVPNETASETMDFTYHLNITAYKKVYPVKENTNTPNYDAAPTPAALEDLNADTLLKNYVDCHILFFRYHGDDPADKENTKYSKLIDDDITETVKFKKDNEGNLQPYEVKIYWIWPETLGEAVLTDGTNRTAVCATKDGTNEILTKLNKNPAWFLKDYTGQGPLTQEQIVSDYSILSIRYNNTDQEIGDNIMYLTAEMSVSTGS